MSGQDPEEQRAEMLELWERAAGGWARRADQIRAFGMPVSAWMIEAAAPQPGERVLELAAGPGDTGFLAAEVVRPGGRLICSDGSEAMLEVARGRAAQLGIDNVEFKRLELEWIDLPTASVDVALCRWGLMLSVDPAAALQEMRRVLAPGGRVALAVWSTPPENPWATIPTKLLVERGLAERPAPDAPGMFALSAPGVLGELMAAAGFVEVVIDTVDVERAHASAEEYFDSTCDLSLAFREVVTRLEDAVEHELRDAVAAALGEFQDDRGIVRVPGRSLVARASA